MLTVFLESWLFGFVVAGLLCVLAGFAVLCVFERYSNKQHLMKNVMLERTHWRKQLRDEVSEFCALATKHYYDVHGLESDAANEVFARNVERLVKLRVQVRLRLNPLETIDSVDTKLVRTMSRVVVQFESKQYDNLHRELFRIERCTQRVLKSEWEKSKREARTGHLQGS